jgi:hypothetical protein
LETGPETRVARPMTRDILAKINDFILAAPRTLRQWRTAWRVNLAFFCLLRWDDVCRLQVQVYYFYSLYYTSSEIEIIIFPGFSFCPEK